MSITGSNSTYNNVEYSIGGALYVGGVNAVVNGSSLIGNTAMTFKSDYQDGGAVYVYYGNFTACGIAQC